MVKEILMVYSAGIKETPDKKVQDRKLWIDITKGVLMIFVMLSHVGAIPYPISKYPYCCYMAAYFVLSGYLFNSDKNVNIEKLKRKELALLKSYFGYSAFLVIVTSIEYIFRGGISWNYLLNAIKGVIYSRVGLLYPYWTENQYYFFTCQNGALWFITALVLSNIWMFVWLQIVRKDLCFGYCYIGILFIITCLLSELPILLPWSLDTSFCGTIFMIVGYELKKMDIQRYITTKYHRILILGIIVICYGFLVTADGDANLSIRFYGKNGYLSILGYIATGILGSIIFCFLGKLLEKSNICRSLIGSIGRHTIALMGLQFWVFHILDLIFIKYKIYTELFFYRYLKVIISLIVINLVDILIKQWGRKFVDKF